jgi:peptidoglycan/LPS O-acetylase OafA/YrhL
VGLRAIRIVPALAVETLLSAIILGPLLTTHAIRSYFTDPLFFKYLCNIVGWIHYRLPGLFLSNPVSDRVNGQLWTVPWELWCYLALIVAALSRSVRVRALFLTATVIATLALFGIEVLIRHGHMDPENGVAAPALLMAFLSAVSIYLYRDNLPWNGWGAAACGLVVLVLFLVPGGDYLVGFPVAYVTIYLGLLNPEKIGILKGADYSYGLYIYHYVIQQAFVFMLPAARHWYFVFPVSFILGSVFAGFSWHTIEKPALRSRKYLPWVERVFAAVSPRKPKAA